MFILTKNVLIDMPLNMLLWAALATFTPQLFFAIYAANDNNFILQWKN